MANITFDTGNIAVGASWVGGVAPGAGDTAIFNAESGTGSVSANFGPVAGWDMSDYSDTLTATGHQTIDVDGTLKLGGTIVAGGGSSALFEVSGNFEALSGLSCTPGKVLVKHNDIAANARTVKTRGLCGDVAFEVNNSGIMSLTSVETGGDKAVWKSIDIANAAGVDYDADGNDHDIGGHILLGAGADVEATGKWTQAASGNVSNPTAGNKFASLSLAPTVGVTSTLTGNVTADSFEYGAGAVVESGVQILKLQQPTANNFFVSGTGSLTVSNVYFYWYVANRSNGAVRLDGILSVRGPTGVTLTMTGEIDIGSNALKVKSSNNGTTTLDMNGQPLTAGAVTVGDVASAARLGEIKAGGGIWNIASLQAAKADADANKVDFGSAYITCSGTITGERNAGKKITFTHINAEIHGGTITKCDFSATNTLYPYECTDGLGNLNVIFDSVPPGSFMLMGVGR